jgi:hypothetical protein
MQDMCWEKWWKQGRPRDLYQDMYYKDTHVPRELLVSNYDCADVSIEASRHNWKGSVVNVMSNLVLAINDQHNTEYWLVC